MTDQGIENRRRHDGSRVMVKDEEDAAPELEPKQLTGAPETNDAAAARAARQRGEDPEEIGATPKLFTGEMPPLDDGGGPAQRRGGGGGGGGGGRAGASGDDAPGDPGTIVVPRLEAWGAPAAPIAKHLRVLRDPKPWVKL